MSYSEEKIIKYIEYYKKSIAKHEQNKEKILHCIQKLSKFPMTISILQKTSIGLIINSLRKYEGEVGNAAKVLVTKWKDIVRKESEDQSEESEIEDEIHSEDSGVDNESDASEEDYKPQMNGKNSKEKHSFNSSSSKSKKDITQTDSSKRKIERNNSGDERQNHSSSSKKQRYSDEKNSKKSSHESSRNKSRQEDKKRKYESSENSDSDGGSDSDSSSSKSCKRLRPSKTESEESSCEKDSDSVSGVSKFSNHSESEKKKYADKHEKSLSKVSKSSSNHHNNSSKDKSHSSHRKHDYKSSDHKSSDHKSSDHKSSDHKSSGKSKSKSSHSSIKTSQSGSKSEKHDEKKHEKSSSKDKHSKNGDHHKSKSKHSEVKIKVEKEEKKSSKSGKDSLKAQSLVKVKQEKENFSANSFEAALNAMSASSEQTKQKTKVSSKSTSSSSKSSEKHAKHSDSPMSRPSKSPITSPQEFDLFSTNVKLEPLDEKDIASALPELASVYHPLPQVFKKEKTKSMTEDEALTSIMTTKNQRTKVYSGNKASYTKVPSLFDLCIRVLQENIELLEYTGGVPYDLLKPILERATPDQLFSLEHYNPYLKDDTDCHWEFHCKRDFRNERKEEGETWRDVYVRCVEERQQKLEKLTHNINQSIAQSTPVRKTKLAYLDTAVKPPRNVARKQNKHGTGSGDIPSSSKHDIIAKSVKGESSGSKASEAPVKVTSPSMQRASNYVNNLIKKKKAPLMQKALQLIKGNRFKR